MDEAIRQHAKATRMSNNGVIDLYLNKAEDKCTAMAKADKTNRRRVTIDTAHSATTQATATMWQQGKNAGQAMGGAV